ncbi:MAG: hypothetical protein ACFCD0_16550 [Gemmataceae bacterium]
MMRAICLIIATGSILGLTLMIQGGSEVKELRIATFDVDVTPPIGSPVAYASARKIDDPLTARGVVLLGAGQPIVLCAVDFIGIGNEGFDAWRNELAEAAGTTPDRVAVHSLHQHDTPRCDFGAEAILAKVELGGKHFDNKYLKRTIQKVAKAIKVAIPQSRKVTHVGVGKAKVEKVASNRRLLGPDGKVELVRWSRSTNPMAIAAPEGVIDPYVGLVSFWSGSMPIASLTYYATHPQSYYGQGDVTSDFPGIARTMRDKQLPKVLHVHFTGAGGNVAAGKYNDGSKKMRPILAKRVAQGMKRAWEGMKKSPITPTDVLWTVVPVELPVASHLEKDKLVTIIRDKKARASVRLNSASHLAWLERCKAGKSIDLSCLRLGKTASIVHMPGELFVEYQLMAQKMLSEQTVCMAAYGDYGPGYIGTEIAYTQGGYETSQRASRVGPKVEGVLRKALKKLLR